MTSDGFEMALKLMALTGATVMLYVCYAWWVIA